MGKKIILVTISLNCMYFFLHSNIGHTMKFQNIKRSMCLYKFLLRLTNTVCVLILAGLIADFSAESSALIYECANMFDQHDL